LREPRVKAVGAENRIAKPFPEAAPAAPGSLGAALAVIPDPRRPTGWRPDHPPLPLVTLLQVCVVAILCGARSLYAIAQWGREQEADDPTLLAALGVPAGGHGPGVATLHRVFKALDVAAFERIALPALRRAALVALAVGTASTAAASGSVGRAARTELGATTSGPFAVGEIFIDFKDTSRSVSFPDQPPEPRSLMTMIRYPAIGDRPRVDIKDGAPARSAGPFPLIVFAHGFNATPATYTRLLRAWARAGYVVAAPVFPLTNARTPGGAKESDLVNQPPDMSFVISEMLVRDTAHYGVLAGLIARPEIAVSGQSDGGSTALAVAYNSHYRDGRARAAMILSGAEIPGVSGYDFPSPSPPLLATQGTADTSNAPASTYRYFGLAPKPKFLLSLLGGAHLPPYTSQEPQLGIVERVTIAFLDRYLKQLLGALGRMWKAGDVNAVATLSSG